MGEENKQTLPLGIMRQAIMKLDSFIADMHECIEDEDISEENRNSFRYIAEVAGNLQAGITNMAMQEVDEAEFLAEQIDPDEIEVYPGTESDIMNEEM